MDKTCDKILIHREKGGHEFEGDKGGIYVRVWRGEKRRKKCCN